MTTSRGPWAVLFALCVGQSLGLLNTTVVNVAVPAISADLDATLGIGVQPVDALRRDEGATARVARQLGLVDRRRHGAVLPMGLRGRDDAPPGHGDHAVAGARCSKP